MAFLCGGGGEPASPEEQELNRINAQANKEAKAAVEKENKIIKMLLLGAGESGKSTIFKQMKIINKNGYTEAERKSFVPIVHSNTVGSMILLMEAVDRLGLEMPADLKELRLKFEEAAEDEKLDEAKGAMIKQLWEHSVTQAAFLRKNEFQLNDSADYYFKDIERITGPDYIPTEQDVLRSRVRTTGIVQTDFKIKSLEFLMFDVGGQRNERRKWIHAFDSVHSIIFVAALSEFDQVLYEDESQNRMDEAISLFDQIVNSKWFADTAIILFLNKKDLFEAKIAQKRVSDYFSEYDGDDADFEATSNFFKEKFLAKSRVKDKSIYTHITCATDTSNVKFVFNAVIAIILDKTMKDSGLQ